MNLVLKALNKEKNKVREFEVSFSKTYNFAIIYDYAAESESFLPVLVDGIKGMSTDDVSIYCSEGQIYEELVNIKKVIITEEKLELIEPKNQLTDTRNEVKSEG